MFYWRNALILLEKQYEACAGKYLQLAHSYVTGGTLVPGGAKLTFSRGTTLRELLLV